MRRHPSKRALRDWLLGEASVDLQAHLDECEKCAETLEHLEKDEGLGGLAETLALVLAPPSDLTERLESGVSARLDSRMLAGIVFDLFQAGIETSRILLSDDPRLEGS